MRRWLVVLVFVMLVALAGVAVLGRNRSAGPVPETAAPAVPVEVAGVSEGTVVRTVEVSGTVVAARTAELFPKISGRVARVLVQDGARVAAGQVLIELDAADQRAEVRQAEAAVAAAEARLALLRAGQRPQERQIASNALAQAENQMKAAQTQVALAQTSLRIAEDNLRRQEQLLREGAIAQAQVDQARLQHDQARAQVQAAESQLEIARAGVDSARQQLELTQLGARDEEIQAARAQVAQAHALAALARQRLANMSIRAPFAGRVSGIRLSPGDYVVSGDFAARGAPVALVHDDQIMEVEVNVGERDIGLIRVGQPTTLRLEGAPDVPVPAVIRLISPAADAASRASAVRLRLGTVPPGAVPGMFARGEITVERREGVLLVPRAAIVGDQRPVVRVVADGVIQIRTVTLGLTQGDLVEVLSGLTAEQVVVVLGPESLPAGTAVQIVRVVTR
jgi:RND family efflux transporter MFP subunit